MRHLALILLVSFGAFWFQLGKLGFIDPDEPFYALTAREMVQSGDWITPQIFGKPQFEKPIFYYWFPAAAFKFLGESEFAGRLPTAIAATILSILTYFMGRTLFNRRAALIAALFMTTGIELMVMGRLMLTDIPLTIFASASIYCYWLALKRPEKRDFWIFWHLTASAMAVLTKGPIGSLIPLFTSLSFTCIWGKPFLLRGKGFWWGAGVYAVVVVPWYLTMIVMHGWPFIDEFFIRDNWLRFLRAEHPANNHMWYYPGVFLLGSIPWLPGALLAWRELFRRQHGDEPLLFVQCWFWANLLFLTAAASKLPSYGFYLFVPFALMLGRGIDVLIAGGYRSKVTQWVLLIAAALQAGAAFVAPFVPTAKPFTGTIITLGVLMTAALVFLALRQYRAWIGATSAAGVAFIVYALGFNATEIERVSSVKPIAREMVKAQKEGEPLMAGKFAVRGIIFYTHQPVSVIANNSHPFWADHPLEIVGSNKSLNRYLDKHGSALVTMRKPEWAKYQNHDAFEVREINEWFGENLFIRGYSDDTQPKRPEQAKQP